MTTVDEDLTILERGIRTLKIEYEQYFGGGRSRPPADTEWRCEQIVKRYDGRTAEFNSGQRFRFTNLTQTYAKYKEIWRKKMRQREEGRIQRHFGAAAREIEAERARARANYEKALAASGQASPSSPQRPPRTPPASVSPDHPEPEVERVDKLYRAMLAARELTGESSGTPNLENFRKFVRRKTDQLKKEKPGAEIEYAVEVENGKAKLKARVKS